MENKRTIGEIIKSWASENLAGGKAIRKGDLVAEILKIYPTIKVGTLKNYLIRYSVNAPARVNWSIRADRDDIFLGEGKDLIRLYKPGIDPAPIYNKESALTRFPDLAEIEEEEIVAEEEKAFALESDLSNYLAKNLNTIEKGLTLFEKDGIEGIEYPVGGRFIDILALDKEKNFVVIELKVSRGYEKVIGQILRYTNWVKKNMAEPGQTVRGIIIARSISEDLKLATLDLPNISLFEYELRFSLNMVQSL